MPPDTRSRITSTLASLQRPNIDRLLTYLETSDFYTAPASTRFHGANPGGLAEHSWNVYTVFKDKIAYYEIDLPADSIVICALLHDVCKIGVYHKGTRNVKENGSWIQKDIWEFRDPLPYGHGEKSVYIIQQYITLTEVEAFTIRWHMGFSESKDNYNTLSAAAEKYPSVIALHTADVEASYLQEKREV